MTSSSTHSDPTMESESWIAVALWLNRQATASRRCPWFAGICNGIIHEVEDVAVRDQMFERVRAHRAASRLDMQFDADEGRTILIGYMWPRDGEHVDARVMACLLMSLESADEAA
jgi:hypothetical protein